MRAKPCFTGSASRRPEPSYACNGPFSPPCPLPHTKQSKNQKRFGAEGDQYGRGLRPLPAKALLVSWKLPIFALKPKRKDYGSGAAGIDKRGGLFYNKHTFADASQKSDLLSPSLSWIERPPPKRQIVQIHLALKFHKSS